MGGVQRGAQEGCCQCHLHTDDVYCAGTTGKLLHKVKLPVKGPTACTFGGEHLDRLYITTMAEGGGKNPGEGGLYVAKVPGVKGVGGAYRAQLST